MKLINRSTNTKSINWFATLDSNREIESVVKDFKDLILAKGTPALNAINKQLGLKGQQRRTDELKQHPLCLLPDIPSECNFQTS